MLGVLFLSTLALFAITSILFRSFSARRVELGRQFALSGQRALSQGAAEQAVRDLRLSLSYAPDEMGNRVLLAEALAQAHHPDQARGYFLGLLDEQPADGFLNLQLARLARERKDTPAAIAYYRAAAVGNWNGDSLNERFQVQLELADYLIELGDLPSARAELLIAAADAPPDATVETKLGDEFERANDPTDALNLYQKAIKLNPEASDAVYKGGRVAYQMGDYSTAARLLSLARRTDARTRLGNEDADEAERLLESSRRIQELTLTSDLPSQDRIEHLLRALPIARARFASCSAQFNGAQLPSDLQRLQGRWDDAEKTRIRRSSLEDAAQQKSLVGLIFETEEITARVCGAPSGDDALLLQLAHSPNEIR
jgi:tetratricopeptide (TPR) repeat protein